MKLEEMKGFCFVVNVCGKNIGQQRRWLFNADEIRGQRTQRTPGRYT